MLKNLLLGTIPYDDGTKKPVIKWFWGAGMCRLGKMSDKKCTFWRIGLYVERMIDGIHR